MMTASRPNGSQLIPPFANYAKHVPPACGFFPVSHSRDQHYFDNYFECSIFLDGSFLD